MIVGGKNSAAEAALEIHRAGGHVTMVHRGAGFGDSVKYWVKPDIENRVKEGSIAAHFNANVVEIRSNEVVLDTGATLPAEAVLLLTGYRADPEFMRRIGVEINDETLEPKYNVDTYETNVPGLVRGRRTGGGEDDRHRVHRERPLSRRGDRQGDRRRVRDDQATRRAWTGMRRRWRSGCASRATVDRAKQSDRGHSDPRVQ